MKQRQKIEIDSTINNIKEDDHIFVVEFNSEEGLGIFEFKEFKFIKLLNETHIEGIEQHDGQILAEIVDIKFPKVKIKTDISKGFFYSKKEAVDEFMKMTEWMYNSVKKAYNKFLLI